MSVGFPKPTKKDRKASQAARLADRREQNKVSRDLGVQAYQTARAVYLLELARKQGRINVTDETMIKMKRNARKNLRRIRHTNQWPACEMQLDAVGCDGRPVTDIHHRAGRGKNLLNQEKFVGCCRACHMHVENNREWAMQEGWLESRHDPLMSYAD